MARAAAALVAILFIAIIVGHLLHFRQLWLVAAVLALWRLARCDPRAPLIAVVAALPVLQIQFPATPTTYMITPSLEVCVLTVLVLWLLPIAFGLSARPDMDTVTAWLLLFLALALGSAIAATTARVYFDGLPATGWRLDAIAFRTRPLDTLYPARQLLLTLEGVLLFWLVRTRFDRKGVDALALALLGSAIATIVAGFGVYLTINSEYPYQGVVRATSLFSGPNQLATYLIMVVPIAVVSTQSPRLRVRWLGRVVTIGACVLLYLTRSDGAWFATVGAMLCVPLTFRTRIARLLRTAQIAITGVLLIALIYFGILLITESPDKINQLSDGRYFLFRSGLHMIQDSPIFGIGLGNFYKDLGAFYPEGIEGRELHEHAHNMYLQLAAELGPIALIVFMVPLVVLTHRAIRVRSGVALSSALWIGMIAVLLHSLTDYTLWIAPLWILFWIYTGTLAAALNAATVQAHE